jgi:hypothetical protein
MLLSGVVHNKQSCNECKRSEKFKRWRREHEEPKVQSRMRVSEQQSWNREADADAESKKSGVQERCKPEAGDILNCFTHWTLRNSKHFAGKPDSGPHFVADAAKHAKDHVHQSLSVVQHTG